MAGSGLCQSGTAISFSVFSHFSAYSVLRFCGGRETKVKSFNTEDTEKGEETKKSSAPAHAEVIRAVLTAMIYSPEFWLRAAFRAKVKTPFELVVSARRALGAGKEKFLGARRASE